MHEKTRGVVAPDRIGALISLLGSWIRFGSDSVALKPRVRSRVTGPSSDLGALRFVREDEVVVVLSFEGSGEISWADMLEATWLLTSDSSSDSNMRFGGFMLFGDEGNDL